ncbi:MAG: sodium-dependent transporter [Cetobacterium sp.]|uniref:sodium-dependent transporter n=1 Tax=Cetobacterium sp. TaxID=2071632 RepID=UPI003F403E07
MEDIKNSVETVLIDDNNRDGFKSRFGFILACIGSAVGMGNIWMFPYRVGQFGGAAFLIPYFTFVLLIGFTGVIGEMTLGRSMGTGPLGAFEKAFKQRGLKGGTIIGLIPVIGSLAIAIGYAVVVGWILRYCVASLSGAIIESQPGPYFGALASNFGSVSWHIAGLLLTFSLMAMGIAGGIEKVNKILMPAFFGLFLFLAIRIYMLPGAEQGYSYLFNPNWSALKDIRTWVFALGQAFFSLSLAGSGTIVYGSYLSKNEDIVNSALNVSFFDTCAAMLAALVVIPAVFAYGLEPGAGPGLMFVTLPTVFQNMPGGQIIAIVFFIAVLFAGVTSLMNLFETPVEALQSRLGLSRLKSIGIVAVVSFTVGVFLEGDGLSPWMDFVSIYIIPLGALLAGLVIYWICKSGFAREQVQIGREKKVGAWFEPVTKYLFCGIAIIVYIVGILYGGIG